MRKAWAIAVVGMLVFPATARPQSLAEAARREKERQEKEKEKQGAAKVMTDEELKSNKGQLSNDTSIPPAVTPAPASASGSRRLSAGTASASAGSAASVSSSSTTGLRGPIATNDEAGWRSRHGALLANIARLEKEVAQLDKQGDATAIGPSTQGAPPKIPGRPPLETARDRQMREGGNAAANMDWQKKRTDILDRLERARGNLVKARQDLATFEEQARRAGIPPGWLR